MRFGFTLLVALLLAVPAAAQTSGRAAILVNVTFSGSMITGTFGGVPVAGTFSGTDAGTFTLTVDGEVFAMGSFVCTSPGCTFMGTQLLGRTTQFTFTSPTLTNPARGTFTGVFPTYGAWVSAVTRWATRHLEPERRGPVIRAAARAKAEVEVEADGRAEARPVTAKGKETERAKEKGRRK